MYPGFRRRSTSKLRPINYGDICSPCNALKNADKITKTGVAINTAMESSLVYPKTSIKKSYRILRPSCLALAVSS